MLTAEQTYTIERIERLIERHWRDYQGSMYSRLKASGELEDAIGRAAQSTRETMDQFVAAGRSEQEAWMEAREEWAILPEN